MRRQSAVLATLLLLLAAAGQSGANEVEAKARKQAVQHLRKGQKELAAGKFDQAETALQAAVAADPGFAPALLALGQTYMATRRYSEALAVLLRCKTAFEESVAERLRDEAATGADREDRIRSLNQLLFDLQSGRVRVDNLARAVAQTEQELRQLEQARGRGLAVTAPVPAVAWLTIGSAHFRLGHKAEATAAFESAIAQDPKLGEAHNNLAVLYMMDGRFDDAGKEIAAAEGAGFAVSPKFKDDLAARKARTP